jgi:hypothetical protein
MRVAIQMGSGMMKLAKALVATWNGGTVIVSPRDLERDQIIRFGKEVSELSGELLIDPQCYVRASDHGRLTKHEYWTAYKDVATNALCSKDGSRKVVKPLTLLCKAAGAKTLVLPGLLGDHADELWSDIHRELAKAAKHLWQGKVLATISLDASAMCDEDEVEAAIEYAADWPVDGYYVVCESPSNYLVSDVAWLANRMSLVAGLKLHGRRVVVGYCSHQALPLACTGVDTIATGKWLKVRSFVPDEMFFEQDEDSVSRRAVWYYAATALSEYKMPALDRARQFDVLTELAPPSDVPSREGAQLFKGGAPSLVRWGETHSASHYLSSVYRQALNMSKDTYAKTKTETERVLEQAKHALRTMTSKKVRGEYRDFSAVIRETEEALTRLHSSRGPLLARAWPPSQGEDDE